jgi:hypothetical protein
LLDTGDDFFAEMLAEAFGIVLPDRQTSLPAEADAPLVKGPKEGKAPAASIGGPRTRHRRVP